MKVSSLFNLRMLAIFFALAGLVFISSCGDDEPDPTDDGTTDDMVDDGTDPTMTIAEILAADSDLSEFTTFVNADAELKGYIEGTADYTVFAPNNAAFDRLRASLGVSDLSDISSGVIGLVLRYHFVAGKLLSADVLGTTPTTLQGENLTVSEDGFVTGSGTDTDGSEILVADQEATNGVVHEMETTLVPPLLFLDLAAKLGKLAQPIQLGAAFTDLNGIVAFADGTIPDGEMGVGEMLADGSGTQYTIFVPTNEVLDGVVAASETFETKEDLVAYVTQSAEFARGFLLNHIVMHGEGETKITGETVAGFTYSEQGIGPSVTTVSGKTLTLIRSTPVETAPGCTNGGDFCYFLAGDVADQATYVPIFATDVYKANDSEGNQLDGATNGAIHVSSIIL